MVMYYLTSVILLQVEDGKKQTTPYKVFYGFVTNTESEACGEADFATRLVEEGRNYNFTTRRTLKGKVIRGTKGTSTQRMIKTITCPFGRDVSITGLALVQQEIKEANRRVLSNPKLREEISNM